MTTSTVTDNADKATSAPLFSVVKGNPSASEIAALTAVFAQLSSQARRDAAGAGVSKHGERNLWGRPEDRFNSQLQFNPAAFKNVRFY
ncbi:MAG: acyl-CoA carboxylase subunit epsilon [Corynebacterium casei]|uniref:acyl-CoA carboxylase subunit epsilon n=1 Tax=Corynebacterium sp. TaxID=1720 RepID=UPI0026FA514B|nr:acyl-CoA carboxylase subunit epsilon [Corynebacterium sp.]MDO5508778.1 acyl-CoA carboxylase subunit epsilon [Corynebacterium casei]